RQQQEHGDINHSGAESPENQKREFAGSPVKVKLARRVPHAEKSRGEFLYRLNAKLLEEHLKQSRNRTQHHAIKFPLDDVVVAEVVEVQADDVEHSVRDQREAVEENFLGERPIRQRGDFLKQHNDKGQREDRGGEAGGGRNDEIAAIRHPHLRILRKIFAEQNAMPHESTPDLLRGAFSPCFPHRIFRNRHVFLAAVNRDFFCRALPPPVRREKQKNHPGPLDAKQLDRL